MGKVRNEDIGMNVIRRVNKFYQVLSADMDEMKVIFWVPFDHDDEAKIAELNRYIKDIENSKNHPNTKKGPYEFEFGFGNPDLGGEIHSLEGMKDDDSFVLSAWFDDTNALYDLEEENSYTEDIFRVITYYLHRLKCDKDSYYGESVLYKGNKMNLSEAKQELREHGYSLLKETRRPGMQRQVFKPTGGDFEDFMNDTKIKALYNSAVREKKNSDKELIADGNDPDEYDAIWNYMDDSYYEKLEVAVNKFFGEEKINVYTKPSSIVVETENNEYEFDTSSGMWDNIDLGTGRQDPAEFFKTIFMIATEK